MALKEVMVKKTEERRVCDRCENPRVEADSIELSNIRGGGTSVIEKADLCEGCLGIVQRSFTRTERPRKPKAAAEIED